jgi:hypothetical protein
MTDLLAAEPQSAGHPFLSLPALREEHAILLKAVRQGDPSPAVLRQVEEFIRRGQILGTVLDAYEDRWAAQSLLDYWATTLDRFGRSMPEATLADFNPNLAPELDDSLCPYRGLEAFQREDFQAFADDPGWSEQDRRQRQAWITEIRANRNPFTARLLRELLEAD